MSFQEPLSLDLFIRPQALRIRLLNAKRQKRLGIARDQAQKGDDPSIAPY